MASKMASKTGNRLPEPAAGRPPDPSRWSPSPATAARYDHAGGPARRKAARHGPRPIPAHDGPSVAFCAVALWGFPSSASVHGRGMVPGRQRHAGPSGYCAGVTTRRRRSRNVLERSARGGRRNRPQPPGNAGRRVEVRSGIFQNVLERLPCRLPRLHGRRPGCRSGRR